MRGEVSRVEVTLGPGFCGCQGRVSGTHGLRDHDQLLPLFME